MSDHDLVDIYEDVILGKKVELLDYARSQI